MKSTVSGKLTKIESCQLVIPIPNAGLPQSSSVNGYGKDQEYILVMNNLPDVSDSKTAMYNPEPIIGRSVPLYTYSHSGDRTINLQIHFFVIEPGDADKNLLSLRVLQSAVYPREDSSGTYPYLPPPVCRLKCGSLLTSDQSHLCVIMQSYNVKFPTEVAWHESNTGLSTFCPYRFDVDTTWLVVYSSEDLPFQSRIVTSGR